MDRKTVLVVIAALLFAAGLILGTSEITADLTSCGSVLWGGGDASELREVAICESKIGDRKPLVYGGIGLAIVAMIVAIAIKEDEPRHA